MPPRVTPRPFGYGGGAGKPLSHARWIATHAVVRIEPSPTGDGLVRLVADDGHLDTWCAGLLVVGRHRLADGRPTITAPVDWIARQIGSIVEWEAANPGERRLGQPCTANDKTAARIVEIAEAPTTDADLVDAVAVDAVLAKVEQTTRIRRVRDDARRALIAPDLLDAFETARRDLAETPGGQYRLTLSTRDDGHLQIHSVDTTAVLIDAGRCDHGTPVAMRDIIGGADAIRLAT